MLVNILFTKLNYSRRKVARNSDFCKLFHLPGFVLPAFFQGISFSFASWLYERAIDINGKKRPFVWTKLYER